jgi:hypothetical protein
VIACTAGFILSSGILFPGTYSRLESFKRNGKDAAKVLISLVPIFIVAAFFESYVTHLMSETYTDGEHTGGLPEWASILILTVSLSFIIWYFVILPIRLHKKGYYIQPDGIINRLKEEHA